MATRKKTPKAPASSGGTKPSGRTPAAGTKRPQATVTTTEAVTATAPAPVIANTDKTRTTSQTSSGGVSYVPSETSLPIEVGDKPLDNVIIRDGIEIVTPELDFKKADAYIDGLAPIVATQVPRVLSQSVPTGTRVLKGTAVDLVLVPPYDVELGVIKDAHADMVHYTVPQVQPVLEHPSVAPIVEQFAKSSDLNADQRQMVTNVMTEYLGVTIDDGIQGKSFDAAYRMLRGAKAYT